MRAVFINGMLEELLCRVQLINNQKSNGWRESHWLVEHNPCWPARANFDCERCNNRAGDLHARDQFSDQGAPRKPQAELCVALKEQQTITAPLSMTINVESVRVQRHDASKVSTLAEYVQPFLSQPVSQGQ